MTAFEKRLGLLFDSLLLLVLFGCAGASGDRSHVNTGIQTANSASVPSSLDAQSFRTFHSDHGTNAQLTRLWETRNSEELGPDYPLGPGDLLVISVPDIDELKQCVARVNGAGNLSLPSVGTLKVSGKTETQLRDEIQSRLNKYLVDPQFSMFVREYRSRQVAVVGSVAKPGLYELKSPRTTILDVLDQAGGRDKNAAQHIFLIPSQSSSAEQAQSNFQPALHWRPQLVSSIKTDPIGIDLRALDRGAGELIGSLPARPGDVILVPDSGEVMVEGWVNKPGNYKVTPGLSLQGAIAAAGGPLFAADTDRVQLVRTSKDGDKTIIMARADSSNTPVQEGDVIDVSYSTAKILPYGLASFITHVGLGLPVY